MSRIQCVICSGVAKVFLMTLGMILDENDCQYIIIIK